MRKLSYLLAIMAAVAVARNGSAAYYKGTVFSPADAGVPNATVLISDGVGTWTTTTGATGTFSYNLAQPGLYTAQASADGGTKPLHGFSRVNILAGDTERWGSIRLAPGGHVKGAVAKVAATCTDDDIANGTKLVGVKVKLLKPDGTLALLRPSPDGGVYDFKVPAGTYQTSAEPPAGYAFVGGRSPVVAPDGGTSWGSVCVKQNDATSPTVAIVSPADGTALDKNEVTIQGTATDDVAVATAAWARQSPAGASVNLTLGVGGAFQFTAPVQIGDNTFRVTATDGVGNSGSAEVMVSFQTGFSGYVTSIADSSIRIAGAHLTLSSGGSVVEEADSAEEDGSFRFDVAAGSYQLEVTHPEYEPTMQTVAVSPTQRGSGLGVVLTPGSSPQGELHITSPANGATVASSPVEVTGTATGFTPDSVLVNGEAATLLTGGFRASVALEPGSNIILAVAPLGGGEEISDLVEVTYEPPGGVDSGNPENQTTPHGTPKLPEGACGCGTGVGGPLTLALGVALAALLRRRR